MAASHGSQLRGLKAAAKSSKFEGRFGKMFHHLAPARYGASDIDSALNLIELGKAMSADHDDPSDGSDAEESAIPSLYTYFGQFIDHDLTFGPEGLFQKIHDPNAVVDFRTPAFDLDCVYGRGPGDQPYMYDGNKFILGKPIDGGSATAAFDLPRNNATPARAIIGDPRNDENKLVSQLQGLFLQFHNRMVDLGLSFAEAQKATQRHYQYVILNDFLPQIVSKTVLDSLKTGGQYDEDKILFFEPLHIPFMPVEYATAAYRFGHSMIRPGYRLNSGDTLLQIFATEPGQDDLLSKRAMGQHQALDWARFIDTEPRPFGNADTDTLEVRKMRLQFAYKIDTSLVDPLAHLPAMVADNPPPSLAQRNLLRSFNFGLPSGQTVATRMGYTPLDESLITIGKAVDGEPSKLIADISPVFKNNCPLWTYILAEAAAHADLVVVNGAPAPISTPRLGPVGGRIVAEVFLGLMFADSESLLGSDENREWVPDEGADYRLRDFVRFAAPAAMGTGA